MAILMSVLNYYVFLPAYTLFLNMPAMSGPEARAMIVAGILPFNFVKGILMSVIFMLMFTRMKTWIERQQTLKSA